MNIWIKSITGLFLFSVFCISLHAQKGYVIDKKNKKIVSSSITSDAKGVLTIATGSGGRIKTKMNPGQYKYARIDMTKDLKKAAGDLRSKKYAAAATALRKLYSKYRFVGWDVFCAFASAQAFNAEGKDGEAIDMLEKLGDLPVDPSKMKYYMRGMKLLAELYAKTGNTSKTMSTLDILSQSNDNSIAAFSNNLKGDLLLKQGKKKDAKLMYMRTALLFGKNNKVERPEALFKTIQMLRSEKNNKALEFEKMLKNDYPSSKYIQDL